MGEAKRLQNAFESKTIGRRLTRWLVLKGMCGTMSRSAGAKRPFSYGAGRRENKAEKSGGSFDVGSYAQETDIDRGTVVENRLETPPSLMISP